MTVLRPSLLLLLFVASCMLPQGGFQDPYQQESYQQGPYQPGQYGGGGGGGGGGGALRIVYEQPTKKPQREEIKMFLESNGSFEKVAAGLSRTFVLPQDINVVWTECGAVNAAWNGRSIVMCYEMAEFLKTLFSKRIQDKMQLRLAVMSSLMFVFLHELGHGLIATYKLPAVGREEDAADQLASLLLITTGDVGVEVAMRGAGFFRLLALSNTKLAFFDEHSLDAQRYYNLLCLVYGSNPQRLGQMVGNDKLPESRARRCPAEYGKVYAAWNNLLSPHMQKRGYAGQNRGYDNTGYGNRGYGNGGNRGYGNGGYDDADDDYEDAPRAPRSGYPSSRNAGYPRGSGGSSSGQWLCRAVGSYVPSGSDGPDYGSPQNVDASKVGRTRDEAGMAALDACQGMLAISTNISIYPNALVTNHCRVISCSQ